MISFILIGRNEGERLIRSINSVYKFVKEENINNYEIIYVDSKSSDESINNAMALGVNKIFLIEGICNAAIGRNIGAKESQGDILFFLDGDMELIPGFFSSIVDMDGNMKYPFVSGIENDILYDNEWNHVTNRCRRKFIPNKDTYEKTTGGLFCITKHLWQEVGGMDNRFFRCQDLDLGIRLYRKGFPLCRKPQIWVNHHTRFYAVRQDLGKTIKYNALLIRKHLFEPKVQLNLLISTYSYWILIGCLIAMFFIPFWIPPLFYLSVVLYRSVRDIQRTDVKLNLFKRFMIRFKNDFAFWYYFISLWPKTPRLRYRQIRK